MQQPKLSASEIAQNAINKSISQIDWMTIFVNTLKDLSLLWQLWLLLGVVILARLIWAIYQNNKLAKSGIFEIDRMSGSEFEERMAILFRNLGYEVQKTGRSGDFGVDLLIQKNGRRIAVQLKCYRSNVGENAIQQAYAGKNMYRCNECMVITNSNFTKWAWKLAKTDNVKLWNRNYLIKVLLTEKNLKQGQSSKF